MLQRVKRFTAWHNPCCHACAVRFAGERAKRVNLQRVNELHDWGKGRIARCRGAGMGLARGLIVRKYPPWGPRLRVSPN